jgi:acyl-coenzyme A thioesterase PaaI-like protein
MRRRVEEGDPEAGAPFDHSPFIGLANPLSPPLHFEYRGDRLYGTVTFGSAYEGPPGCVHGGYVAAAFDELLGAAQSMSGTQGMTARLEVNYRNPTPLGEPLHMEGWVDRRDGRKIFVKGTLSTEANLTADAEGLFLSLDPQRFEALIVERERRRHERDGVD